MSGVDGSSSTLASPSPTESSEVLLLLGKIMEDRLMSLSEPELSSWLWPRHRKITSTSRNSCQQHTALIYKGLTCGELERMLLCTASSWALYSRALRSAPVNRSVAAASCSSSTSVVMGTPALRAFRISSRASYRQATGGWIAPQGAMLAGNRSDLGWFRTRSGGGQRRDLSSRPGLNRAGSIRSGRLVAAST